MDVTGIGGRKTAYVCRNDVEVSLLRWEASVLKSAGQLHMRGIEARNQAAQETVKRAERVKMLFKELDKRMVVIT